MTATIAYDLPMKNLIDELVATGHVTTRSYRKDSVTIHHNGGRLSHEGVLNVWRTRPASAAFDIDGKGAACQYTKPEWYAWAVGNTLGNQRTISIEMANSSTAPAWEVAEVTWKNAARLAGWLFAKIIGAAPSDSNFFVHSHWSATSCAGPYVAKMWAAIKAEALKWYNYYKGKSTGASPKPAPAPRPATYDRAKTRYLQGMLEITRDGLWGSNTDARASIMIAAIRGSNANMRLVQQIVDTAVDGIRGPNTNAAIRRWLIELQRLLGVTPDGYWGPITAAAWSRFRNNNLNKF